jgi:hypothetical protein
LRQLNPVVQTVALGVTDRLGKEWKGKPVASSIVTVVEPATGRVELKHPHVATWIDAAPGPARKTTELTRPARRPVCYVAGVGNGLIESAHDCRAGCLAC